MWNGLGYLPRHSGSSIWAIFFHLRRIGIAAVEDAAIVLPQIVHHAEEIAVGREADLMAGGEDLVEDDLPMVVVDPRDRILVGQILVELQEGNRIEVLLRVEDGDAAAQPDHGGGPAAHRDARSCRRRRKGYGADVAGNGSLLDEEFAHRHHFPLDLLALGAAVVELSRRLVGIDLGDRQRAAILPAIARDRCELPAQSNFSAAITRDVVRSKQAAMSFCPSVTK